MCCIFEIRRGERSHIFHEKERARKEINFEYHSDSGCTNLDYNLVFEIFLLQPCTGVIFCRNINKTKNIVGLK